MTTFMVALALAAAVPMPSVAARTVKQEARELGAANQERRDVKRAVVEKTRNG